MAGEDASGTVLGQGPKDPEELEAATAPGPAPISALATVGAVHLTVAELGRSVDYYVRGIGLELIERAGGRARLGAGGRELLVLEEEPGARPADGFAGLYHFALLLPERADLARWLSHAARDGVGLSGASDHFVSEALYLSDPDNHGIEIYWDRPRPGWEGQVAARLTSLPLDIPDILAELSGSAAAEPFAGLPAGTVMGHIHLRVSEIPQTVAFYRDTLGFDLMAQLGAQAAFLSAGGYHHHLGANTWESAGAAPAPAGTARLRYATIILPDSGERDRILGRAEQTGQRSEATEAGPLIVDPSGNRLLLAVG